MSNLLLTVSLLSSVDAFAPRPSPPPRIIKLVRAIRKGWIKVQPRVAPEERPEPPAYLLWGDDGAVAGGEGQGPAGKSGSGLTYIPAAKPQLPGHADSYNPPAEYLPTEVREVGRARGDRG